MRKGVITLVALAIGAVAVLVLAGAAQPRSARGFADLAVTKSAPATVTTGQQFDYTITLTYGGTTLSDEATVTDALPSGINFISLTVSQGTCASPQPGTNGTVSCTMRFGPAT